MKVIIIGCTHAGTAAARQILKKNPETEVNIYERNQNISFLSCGISLFLDGTVEQLADMFYDSAEKLAEDGINIHLNHDVIKIDASNKWIMVQNLDNEEIFKEPFDKLILATGSSVAVPVLEGIDSNRILLAKTYLQAQKLKEYADEYERVTVVGGGYAGVELAESLAATGHRVTLFQRGSQLLNNYVDREIATYIMNELKSHGIDVHVDEAVSGFREDLTTKTVMVKTKYGEYDTDFVITTTGFLPNTELLSGQIDLDNKGAAITNNYMQTSNPDIFAIGDVTSSLYNPLEQSIYIPLATNAIRQGIIAANNIYENKMKYMGTQATSGMVIFNHTLAVTGLTLKKALEAGKNAASVLWNGEYRPAYMGMTEELTITLVYERETRLILGAQLFSRHEIAQSANTISVCIQNHNTIDDLAMVDMLFQPNFNEPFHYLNQVAQLAQDQEAAHD